MQHLNDDMDELFRKAADDYPLNTGVPDWNRIAKGLTQDAPPAPPEPKKRYRRFLWLFLLIPIAFIIKEMADPVLLRGNAGAANTEQTGNPTAGAANTELTDNPTAGAEAGSKAIPNEAAGADSNDQPGDRANGSKTAKQDAGKGSNETGDNLRDAGNKLNVGEKPLIDPIVKLKNRSPHYTSQGSSHADRHLNKGGQGSNFADRNLNKVGQGSNDARRSPNDARDQLNNGNKESIAVSKPLHNRGETAGSPNKKFGTMASAPISTGTVNADPDATNVDPYTKTSLVPLSASPDVTLVPPGKMTALETGPITRHDQKTKNFYIGAIGGLDVTTVKFQETSKTGSHFGAIAGYSFARKWSVELGFIVEKKYYYSDGKYFDRSKLNLNANTTVISVDGDCKMFEIPLSVKYDITNSYKSNFFVTGGLSSYIMKQEDYKMVYGYTSGSRSTHYYPYKNSSKNFFAEIRLTGGYALKLPKQFSLRFEPYLNIPITGVGYGKLNLMSAGINAGVFRRIF